MSHIYCCSRCRHRNTFRKAVTAYVRKIPKCSHCGYLKFYVDKERINRKGCGCGGYWFVHRPGSGCCVQNPDGYRNAAIREGVAPELLPPAVKKS